MHESADEFLVDTDDLEGVISEMRMCEVALGLLAREINSAMMSLHGLWQGEAAEAHHLAQAEWQRGLEEMRAALTTYRTNAWLAHGNYVEAAQANARMWGQTT